MKNILQNLTKKQIVLIGIVLLSLLIYGALTLTANTLKKSLDDQRAAQRWSNSGDFAQVSCFFADNQTLDFNQIMTFRSQIEKNLSEAAHSANDNHRSFIDAYSSIGTVNIRSERGRLETTAIGIGGDFFLFHPLKLVNGSYFSGHDLMKDSVILDEEAAWQLFGSSDIAGMPVTIGGVPHYVRGVISRESGRLWEAAGLNSGVAYLSAESLLAYGNTTGIQHYEFVMPNPVSGFAYRVALENFGYTEDRMMVIDNSARYGFESLIRVIAETGTRSMQSFAVRFPYWENYARGFEDILAFILVFQMIFLTVPIIITGVMLFLAYKNRTWLWKDVAVKGLRVSKNSFSFIHKKIMEKRI
ncbi:MAG: ABC transporter permease [Lachnospiraceae bacterium]|nr:ABC transporter permease [Lachnospiraceae bacterium]